MLLYIHVPFCRKKCAYCAFYSLPLPEGRAGADMVKQYLVALIGEIRFWGNRLGHPRLETIFFGGGTPSLLPAKALEGLLTEVRKQFDVAPAAEISAEANPESALADGWLFGARAAGVNRLSLGVQSLHDTDLALLGRCHDARTAEAAVTTARTAGFANISLDFMWGLPGPAGRPQSQRQWLLQLKQALQLQPEHISAYGLILEEGSPLQQACAEGELSLPEEKAQSSMYLAGGEFLDGNGYIQYEISNFSRMGFECRHNLGYWEGADFLGLGPAAASTLNLSRKTNPADLKTWQEQVNKREPGPFEPLSATDALKETLMLRLRTCKGLNLKDWQKRSGRPFLKQYAALAALLQRNGLATIRQGRFRLTRPGMLVSDAILARMFEELDA